MRKILAGLRDGWFLCRLLPVVFSWLGIHRITYFIFLLKVLDWFIPGLSGPAAWTLRPLITCGTVDLFFYFFLRVFICSCAKLHHTRSQMIISA